MSLRGEASDQAPVFRSRKGGHLDESQVWRVVRKASERAGIDKNVSCHWLRHAHASHASRPAGTNSFGSGNARPLLDLDHWSLPARSAYGIEWQVPAVLIWACRLIPGSTTSIGAGVLATSSPGDVASAATYFCTRRRGFIALTGLKGSSPGPPAEIGAGPGSRGVKALPQLSAMKVVHPVARLRLNDLMAMGAFNAACSCRSPRLGSCC